MRILQLAPSGVLGRLQNVTLLAGSLPQEEAFKNGRGSMLWGGQFMVFHLSNRCCVDSDSATKRTSCKLGLDLAGTEIHG